MINEETLFKRHIPDGVAEDFIIGLEYLNDGANIKVTYFDGDNDTEYELVLGTNYTIDTDTDEITTITGVYAGGTLVSPIQDSTPTGLSKLTITLDAPFTQKVDITSNSNYDPEVLEEAYDKGVILAKQNKEESGRAVTLSISDAGSEMTLPPKADLANGVLGFDSNGEPIARAGFIPEVWDALFAYSAEDIVQHSGDMWICTITDTGTEPGTETPAVIWEVYTDRKTSWNAAILYAQNEVVAYGGILYIATSLTGNVAKIPGTATTYWTEMNVYGTRWDEDVEYQLNDVTSRTGVLVKSIQNANKGNEPDLTPGATDLWWEIVKTGGSLETEGTVLAATVVNTIMSFDTSGKLITSDNRELSKSFSAGLLVTATTGANEVSSVLSGGLMDGFSGLTIGTDYYLGNSGNLITKGAIAYSEYIVYIGRAVSATELDVKVRGPEPTRNQDDGTPISALVNFATYKDRTGQGYIAYTHDSFSQANYPNLFSEIGHVYNDMHVTAGGADLSASGTLFYATPVPGYYERGGTQDTAVIDSTADVDDATELITLATADYDALHMTRGVLGTGADGVPVRLKLVSGALPTGLAEDTTYFINFGTTPDISLHTTEALAITGASKINLTDAVGTFRITQEGVYFDDAGHGHKHDIVASDTNSLSANRKLQGANQTFNTHTVNDTEVPKSDGVNGTPRTTNETRPKTFISFGYIKAEHITTAGEPVSAEQKIIDWGSTSTWLPGASIILNHGLGVEFDKYIGQIFVRDDAVPDKIYNVTDLDIQNTASLHFGQRLNGIDNDLNNCFLQMYSSGSRYVLDDGSQTAVPTSGWSYKAVLTRILKVATFADTSFRKVFDITTSTDETFTLPDASTQLTEQIIKRRGAGTGKVIMATVSGQTIEGLTASIWELEGEGIIVLFPSGGNWEVKEYSDYGENNNKWWKKKDGTMEQTIIKSSLTGSDETWTFDKTFSAAPLCNGNAQNLTNFGRIVTFNTATTITVLFASLSVSDAKSTASCGLRAIGRWRT